MIGPIQCRILLTGLACVLGGCATQRTETERERSFLPAALTERWTPPRFATRTVEGEPAPVLEACTAVAQALGYTVNRVDRDAGQISAARRQTSAFDGARQDTLELTVRPLAPGVQTVALTLREVLESGSTERTGSFAASSLIRERGAYDVFFSRLRADLLLPPSPSATL
jgi:hypothetical protein